MSPLKSTNLSTVDAALISFWVELPNAVRLLVTIGSIFTFGWAARGTFVGVQGLDKRVTAIESKGPRMEAGMKYLMCASANQNAPACEYIISEYPDLLKAVSPQGANLFPSPAVNPNTARLP